MDGSPPHIFDQHARSLGPGIHHLPPAFTTLNGKVGNVLTGLGIASHERVVIADDDVRYDRDTLARMHDLLQSADVVRPQNYFDPLPWHACWDTARSLLNRMTGGDWPGTLGVRRSVLQRSGGYRGDVLFENLELVRTIKAAGGTEAVPLDLFVRRSPSSTRHFLSQRVRQAYDEMARPWRFVVFLLVLPALALLILARRWAAAVSMILSPVAIAELGRRRAGGRHVFPAVASPAAPVWVVERSACTWLALGARLFLGGVPYRRSVLRTAASSDRELRRRHSGARLAEDLPGKRCDVMPLGVHAS
ncbi:MAG TPA: glycosyltransferase family 2 protein [Chloroflexota bacterium]